MDFGSLIAEGVNTLTSTITENNKRANLLRSAGNTTALVHEVRVEADTEDPTILQYRAWLEQALAAIEENEKKIDAYIIEQGLVKTGDIDVAAETEAWKAANAQIKALRKVLSDLPGGSDAVANLPEVVGIPGTRSGSGGSTGVRRPRFQAISYTIAGTDDEWVDVQKTEEKDGETVVKTNLTLLASVLSTKDNKVTASDLQKPLFDTAGTDDLSTLNGRPVEFAFGVGGVNYIVRVTPSVSE